jgi:hypothetical protein
MDRIAVYLVVVSAVYLIVSIYARYGLKDPMLEMGSQLGYLVLLTLPLVVKPIGRRLGLK